ncbi:anthrone oxygenase family protein [Chryseobacterium sp. OV279]|uniref:anthrone oxygenase family protein n=1 Tax=Chryseobacterium sp. OV279 TaxID=1500285 RepID=UPI000917BDCE|nr:DUF1772 domain-containing protein [Chryseobacterium sp. OV279]SHG70821.1 protein of unknown function [Chryseobacterium sp. OV279]
MKNNQLLKLISLAVQSLFTGGCLVILFVLVPFWQKSNPEDFLLWFSINSPNIAKIMLPLEVIPLILSVLTFYLVNKQKDETRKWWLLNLAANVIILLLFFIYFMPANSSMSSGTIMKNQVKSELMKWEMIHLMRTVLTGISTIFCIVGLQYLPVKKQ